MMSYYDKDSKQEYFEINCEMENIDDEDVLASDEELIDLEAFSIKYF